MKKNILNLLIVGTSLFILIAFVLKTDGLSALAKLNPLWVLVSLLFMLAYWGFESLSLHVIISFHGIRKKFRESFVVTMVGQFFNSITPFATGGQPAQVLYLMKNGVDTGIATSIVMIKFVSFQTVLTLYSLIIIIFTYTNYAGKVPFILTMTILGLAVHASMILVTLLFSYNRELTEKIIKFVFRLLARIKLVKSEESAENKLEDSLTKFHDNASLLMRHPELMYKTFLFTAIQLTFYFSIPFCIYKGFGLEGTSLFPILSASVFVATIISVVPLPGSVGGAEQGFLWFFSDFFNGYPIPAMLIWRIATYYSCIGFGGVFAVILPKKSKEVKGLN